MRAYMLSHLHATPQPVKWNHSFTVHQSPSCLILTVTDRWLLNHPPHYLTPPASFTNVSSFFLIMRLRHRPAAAPCQRVEWQKGFLTYATPRSLACDSLVRHCNRERGYKCNPLHTCTHSLLLEVEHMCTQVHTFSVVRPTLLMSILFCVWVCVLYVCVHPQASFVCPSALFLSKYMDTIIYNDQHNCNRVCLFQIKNKKSRTGNCLTLSHSNYCSVDAASIR